MKTILLLLFALLLGLPAYGQIHKTFRAAVALEPYGGWWLELEENNAERRVIARFYSETEPGVDFHIFQAIDRKSFGKDTVAYALHKSNYSGGALFEPHCAYEMWLYKSEMFRGQTVRFMLRKDSQKHPNCKHLPLEGYFYDPAANGENFNPRK